MRALTGLFCLLSASAIVCASEAQVLKVLPHFVDSRGRHSLSPSLYERDAYQSDLRKHPERIAGIQFDVHWRAPGRSTDDIRVRVEMRTANHGVTNPVLLEAGVKGRRRTGWAALKLTGKPYEEAGPLVAWQVSMMRGDKVLAQKRSFLW